MVYAIHVRHFHLHPFDYSRSLSLFLSLSNPAFVLFLLCVFSLRLLVVSFSALFLLLLIPKALLSGSDYMDDPFIPQRGRRMSSGVPQPSNDGFADQLYSIPLRCKRSIESTNDEQRMRDLKTWAYSFLRNSALITDYTDDPFIPQRGRRAATSADSHRMTDTETRQKTRSKRSASQRNGDEERLRELAHFAYSLLRKSEPLITDYSEDPFIPQRGRRSTPSIADNLQSNKQLKQSPSSRGKRSPNRITDEEQLRQLTKFAYSLLRKSEALTSDYVDDPFVPQRGRRPHRFTNSFDAKRSSDSVNREQQMRQLTNLAYSFLRSSDALMTDYSDDPFIPQRGRRSSSIANNDVKTPSPLRSKRKASAQSIENERLRDLQQFAYSLLRNSASDYADDPFIPQRGRRAHNNKPNKSTGKLMPLPLRWRRSAGAQSTKGNSKAILYKNQIMKSTLPAAPAATSVPHFLHKRQSSNVPGAVVAVPANLKWCCGDGGHDKATTISNQQWPQWLQPNAKKPTTKFIVPNGLANTYSDYTNNADEHDDVSLASTKRILDAALETLQNQQNNLSQENRDALYLARGSQTPFAVIERKK